MVCWSVLARMADLPLLERMVQLANSTPGQQCSGSGVSLREGPMFRTAEWGWVRGVDG